MVKKLFRLVRRIMPVKCNHSGELKKVVDEVKITFGGRKKEIYHWECMDCGRKIERKKRRDYFEKKKNK